MKLIVIIAALLTTKTLFAASTAEILKSEFETLKTYVQTQTPDELVGGLYYSIQKDGYKIIYSMNFDGEHDVIRLFKNREYPKKDFVIDYIYSEHLMENRTVLRRFIGPQPTGWKNHTIDVDSGEYLGSQGASQLNLSEEEMRILNEWQITLF